MALSAAAIAVGDTHTEVLVEDLKRTQLVQYAGASGDYNPVHTDEKFVTEVAGYPTVFAHGMLTMTGTAEVAAIRDEDGQHLVDLTIITVNQDDVPVLTGTATAVIDP